MVPEYVLPRKTKNFMYIPNIQLSVPTPHRSQRQFSVSYRAPFPTLFAVNGLSVALLIRSLVLCNQVLSELRRVHFTGSQGTCSNQTAVFPPACNNTIITFHHCCAVIHSWRIAGTREQTNKHEDMDEIREGLLSQKQILFCLYLCHHWNGLYFAVLIFLHLKQMIICNI